MNPIELKIYSFFMQKEIQFVRYYHQPYTNRTQWKSILKKAKRDVTLPEFHIFLQKNTGQYVFSMVSERDSAQSAKAALMNDPNLAAATEVDFFAICKILHCQPHTISPLGLLFDENHICRISIDASLFQAPMLCLSPCSNESSIFLTPDAFLHQFLMQISPESIYPSK